MPTSNLQISNNAALEMSYFGFHHSHPPEWVSSSIVKVEEGRDAVDGQPH